MEGREREGGGYAPLQHILWAEHAGRLGLCLQLQCALQGLALVCQQIFLLLRARGSAGWLGSPPPSMPPAQATLYLHFLCGPKARDWLGRSPTVLAWGRWGGHVGELVSWGSLATRHVAAAGLPFPCPFIGAEAVQTHLLAFSLFPASPLLTPHERLGRGAPTARGGPTLTLQSRARGMESSNTSLSTSSG